MDFKALVAYKDFETLLQDAFTRLKTAGSKITNLNAGGAFRTLTETVLQAVAELHDLVLGMAPQGFATLATGDWLGLKCADIGLTRRAAVKAAGNLTFGRAQAGLAVRIPAGTVVKTEMSATGQEYRFTTTAEVILAAGALTVEVPVQAEFAGSAYNVGEATIIRLVTAVPGIETVTNAAGWFTVAGADAETDDALRARYLLKWNELAQGGTAAAYASWALGVAGVVDVNVDGNQPRGAGTVDIIITGTTGQPTQALIDQVQAAVNSRKPLTDNALVKAPAAVAVNVTVQVLLPADRGDTVAAQAAAEKAIRALFTKDATSTVAPLRIGEDVYRARMLTELMKLTDVANVVLTAPAADVAVGPGALATLGVLTVTTGRVA